MRIHLMIIDPQNDFCDPNGSLFVPGADEDMKRLAGFVTRLKGKLSDIHVTLDSHRKVDISHPMWWKSSSGKHPDPFTVITVQDLKEGKWTTAQPGMYSRSLAYLEALAVKGRYPHVVWPYHCLIGDQGHNVVPELSAAIHDWEDRFAQADFVTKGSNPWTEHFSAIKAEVPDPEDPSTQVNTRFLQTFDDADIVLAAGEALSHCWAHTIRDMVEAAPQLAPKLHLLMDATSNVPGFEQQGEHSLKEFIHLGMKTTTTKDFLV